MQNYGIIEHRSEKSVSSNKIITSSSHISEEDEFVDELENMPHMTKGDFSRKDSVDSRRRILRGNVS